MDLALVCSLKQVTAIVTSNLNKIIDINYYPVDTAKRSNFRHRPIGIGVQGLADTFILLGMAFDSLEVNFLPVVYLLEFLIHCSLIMQPIVLTGSTAEQGHI